MFKNLLFPHIFFSSSSSYLSYHSFSTQILQLKQFGIYTYTNFKTKTFLLFQEAKTQ